MVCDHFNLTDLHHLSSTWNRKLIIKHVAAVLYLDAVIFRARVKSILGP